MYESQRPQDTLRKKNGYMQGHEHLQNSTGDMHAATWNQGTIAGTKTQ